MIPVGPHKGVIVSHRSRMIGDKIAISFTCKVGTESVEALVFITDKAMNMARRALKVCGFDIDKEELAMLDIKPTLLAGNPVSLVCELYNGKPQVKIDLDSRADVSALADVTRRLRAVKRRDDDAGEPSEQGVASQDYGDVPF